MKQKVMQRFFGAQNEKPVSIFLCAFLIRFNLHYVGMMYMYAGPC